MRYPFVLFDIGETLVGPRESFGAVYSRVLREMGHESSDLAGERLERCLRETWKELESVVPRGTDRYAHFPDGEQGYWLRFAAGTLERATGRRPEEDLVVKLLAGLRDAFGGPSEWRVYPDVVPVLNELREEGFRLAVVSNWDSRLPGLLQQLGLAGLFEAVGVSHLEGVEKPDPELFFRVLRRLGASPEQALHIGDLPDVDLDGARAAGIDAILLDRNGKYDGSLPALRRLDELPRFARGEKPLPGAPRPALADWSLEVWGQVERTTTWNRHEFLALPRSYLDAEASDDGLPGTRWGGVSTREVLARLRPMPDATFVLVHDTHGGTTGFSLAAFAAAGALFAVELDGRPLDAAAGAPVRLMLPGPGETRNVAGVRGLEFLNKKWPADGSEFLRGDAGGDGASQ